MEDRSMGTPILFPETRKFLKKAGIYLLAEVIILLLGFSFVFIIHGLALAFLRSVPYWISPSSSLFNIFPIDVSTRSNFPVPLTWWQVPPLVISIGLKLLVAGLGFWILISNGFCDQNIFCALLR